MIKRLRIIKNKKGFTLVEAIAVTVIMGIIAVLTGSLLASSSGFYNSYKDMAAAKDISKLIEKMIWQEVVNAKSVYLQNGNINSDLPGSRISVLDENNVPYDLNMTNAPFGGKQTYKTFTTYNGNKSTKLVYKDPANGVSSFTQFILTESASSADAFYGDYAVRVYFKGVMSGNGKWQSVIVFCDVYSGGQSPKIIYKSDGRIIEPKPIYGTKKDGVFNFSSDEGKYKKSGSSGTYINLLPAIGDEHEFTYIHFM